MSEASERIVVFPAPIVPVMIITLTCPPLAITPSLCITKPVLWVIGPTGALLDTTGGGLERCAHSEV